MNVVIEINVSYLLFIIKCKINFPFQKKKKNYSGVVAPRNNFYTYLLLIIYLLIYLHNLKNILDLRRKQNSIIGSNVENYFYFRFEKKTNNIENYFYLTKLILQNDFFIN